jgi:hypothetical protein
VALGKLSAIQERVLIILAGMTPPWTLTGGGALAGFHSGHRDTRDLDLFWQQQAELGHLPAQVRERLEKAALAVAPLRSSAAFAQLDVSDAFGEHVALDLVANPVPLAEAPLPASIGATTIFIDTPHQILVNKLCALLGRSEPRDVEDIHVLLQNGGDLERALRDCPQQDAGFSPLTLAWCLRSLPLERLASALGWSRERIDSVIEFQRSFVDRLLQHAHPE